MSGFNYIASLFRSNTLEERGLDVESIEVKDGYCYAIVYGSVGACDVGLLLEIYTFYHVEPDDVATTFTEFS